MPRGGLFKGRTLGAVGPDVPWSDRQIPGHNTSIPLTVKARQPSWHRDLPSGRSACLSRLDAKPTRRFCRRMQKTACWTRTRVTPFQREVLKRIGFSRRQAKLLLSRVACFPVFPTPSPFSCLPHVPRKYTCTVTLGFQYGGASKAINTETAWNPMLHSQSHDTSARYGVTGSSSFAKQGANKLASHQLREMEVCSMPLPKEWC